MNLLFCELSSCIWKRLNPQTSTTVMTLINTLSAYKGGNRFKRISIHVYVTNKVSSNWRQYDLDEIPEPITK